MKKIVILGDKSGFIVSYGDIIFCGKDLKELIEKIEEELRKIVDEPEKPLHEKPYKPL